MIRFRPPHRRAATVILGVVLSVFCAAPFAGAQPLSDAWEVLGTVEATIGEAPATMVAARRIDTGEATVMVEETDKGRLISIAAMTPDAAGAPGLPLLTLKLGPFRGPVPDTLAIDLREAERVLMAADQSESKAVLTDVQLAPDGTLSFAFEADLVVMVPDAEGGFVPLAGAVGQMITGRFHGHVPLDPPAPE